MRLLVSWARDFVDVTADPEEIAERLDISTGTVKNHMIAALRTLRKQIRPDSSLTTLTVFLVIATAFAE